MTTIIALLGMPGSGKSAAAKYLKEDYEFPVIRLGDLTERTTKEQKLELTPKNEQFVREELRREHGMDVYAKLNMPLIEKAAKTSNIVVIDGLYSIEEYKQFLTKFGTDLIMVAIYAPPKIRYERLSKRKVRPLNNKEAQERDFAEIENSSKGGPIALADYTIKNTGLFDFLKSELNDIIDDINDN
ncbi:MAG: AAA family ATPase [Candidatus Aenigmarchaeota archaeon]|nr:AAA family ATPase [Candidatus Aenigmarchaeota archaeon]